LYAKRFATSFPVWSQIRLSRQARVSRLTKWSKTDLDISNSSLFCAQLVLRRFVGYCVFCKVDFRPAVG
jgi:hypothetical protein